MRKSIEKKVNGGRPQIVIAVPVMSDGGHLEVTTAANGTDYVAFEAAECAQMTVINDSGVTIVARQDGAGVAIPIFNQTAMPFYGLTSASQISVRRKDVGVGQVAVQARWET